MRLRFSLLAGALAAGTATAQAQPAQQLVDRIGQTVERAVERAIERTDQALAVSRAYQGRNGPEQTERFSRRIKIGRDGRLSVTNIAGNIVVTAGSGDEVSIDAVKRTRGGSGDLAGVRIDVDERPGRVDVRTTHTRNGNDRVSVDYTIVVPPGVAVEARSISGDITVRSVQGAVRAETISGNVTAAATPRLELLRSVSGTVDLSDTGADGELSVSSISGDIRARALRAKGIDLKTVSGDVRLTDVACDRLGAQSTSGDLEYTGTLARGGRYSLNSHSGGIRLTISGPTGFEFSGGSFSGSIRADADGRVTTGQNNDRVTSTGRTRVRRGPVNSEALQATFGDGSAVVTARTFSGDIILLKR
jgi:DUF4097 and DUF4098 domain-containing protein YvlB